MIYAICGLIGAGKTTYAKAAFENVTDYDEIGSKDEQIRLTRRLHKAGKDVAHITCYPTPRERSFLDGNGATYIWINTSIEQAQQNILVRGRERDLADLDHVLLRNRQILDQYGRTSIDFKVVNVFE